MRRAVVAVVVSLLVLTACQISLPTEDPGEPASSGVSAGSGASGSHSTHHGPPGADQVEHGRTSDRPHSGLVFIPTAHIPSQRAWRRAIAFRRHVLAASRQRHLRTRAQATAAGYRPLEFDPTHWYNEKYLSDGITFDPQRPEWLVILGPRVWAYMFVPESMQTYSVPEPPGAPYMQWHFHSYGPDEVCLAPGRIFHRAQETGCAAGQRPVRRSPLMTHVWLTSEVWPFAAMLDDEKFDPRAGCRGNAMTQVALEACVRATVSRGIEYLQSRGEAVPTSHPQALGYLSRRLSPGEGATSAQRVGELSEAAEVDERGLRRAASLALSGDRRDIPTSYLRDVVSGQRNNGSWSSPRLTRLAVWLLLLTSKSAER